MKSKAVLLVMALALVMVFVGVQIDKHLSKKNDFVRFYGFTPDSSSQLIAKENEIIDSELKKSLQILSEYRQRAEEESSKERYAEIRKEFLEREKEYNRMYKVAKYFNYLK